MKARVTPMINAPKTTTQRMTRRPRPSVEGDDWPGGGEVMGATYRGSGVVTITARRSAVVPLVALSNALIWDSHDHARHAH